MTTLTARNVVLDAQGTTMRDRNAAASMTTKNHSESEMMPLFGNSSMRAVRKSNARIKWMFACLLMLLGFVSLSAQASWLDCVKGGGNATCTDAIPIPTNPDQADSEGWVYDLCNEEYPYSLSTWVWCDIQGGTRGGNVQDPQCFNWNPVFEPDVYPWSEQFARIANKACLINGTDTGWGLTVNNSYNCWNGGPTYSYGIQTEDERRMVFTGTVRAPDNTCGSSFTQNVLALKTRGVGCPAGYAFGGIGADGKMICKRQEGMCPATPAVGHPIVVGTGAAIETHVDYAATSAGGVEVRRYYNSMGFYREPGAPEVPGEQNPWRFSYQSKVFAITGSTYTMASMLRADGNVKYFSPAGAEINNVDGANTKIVKQVDGSGATTGWQYTAKNDDVEQYDANGRLVSITNVRGVAQTLTYDAQSRLSGVVDSYGHQLTFAYDTAGALTITDPASNAYHYTFDNLGNLASVTYPDNSTRTYLYHEAASFPVGTSFAHAMTGIVDENQSRLSTFTYDSQGRATSSSFANGIGKTTLSYSVDNTATGVTDALNTARTYSLATVQGVIKNIGVTQPCSSGCGASAGTTYDARGNVATRTDFNGNLTTYSYEPTRNLQTQRVEAAGTPQARTTTTTWHSTLHVPVQIDEPGRSTAFTYDSAGNLQTKSIKDTATNRTRTWTYSNYTSLGQPQTIDGPRTDVSDVTHLTYYPVVAGDGKSGQVATTTDALGHVTTVNSYDANGRPLTTTDANGLVTTLAYNTRGWITSRQAGSEITSFAYDNVGQLTKVTQSNGAYIAHTYDSAHRLTDVQDQDGNNVHYTLDMMGNRTKEDVTDPSGALARTRSRVYNALNQLVQDIGANASETTNYGYDANGNLAVVDDPLSHETLNHYDALNRLTQITDPNGGVTKQSYDALGHLVGVTDPRNLTTTYSLDGLGNLTTLVSPDTGTATSTYDDAGNLITRTDAKNQTTHYQYDVLNRLTLITYADASQVSYSYDQGSHGIGRLTSMSDSSGSTTWSYDVQGRVVQKTQTIGTQSLTVAYGYDAVGQLTSITLPSGNIIGYTWSDGRITAISLNGSTPILSNLAYQPFSGPKAWTFADGESVQRGYDFDGRVNSMSMGLVGIPSDTKTYSYDTLNRLTDFTTTTSSSSYGYDSTGNRTTQAGAAGTSNYVIDPASNRIQTITIGPNVDSRSYDANGSTTAGAANINTYDAMGRLSSANGVAYHYNGKGQRVRKQSVSATTLFAYDEVGHGIGEYGAGGAPIEETIWLGDMPEAVLKPNGIAFSVYYVHADHLNTPREIDDAQGQPVWAWDTQTFGENSPNDDPNSSGNHFVYNYRFPGQYFDAETGLHYNNFRDYEPAIGRYIESDPIGLKAGPNTYSYALANPLNFMDEAGLLVEIRCRTIGSPHKPDARSRIGAALGGEHCFVHVSCPELQIDDTISYLGPIFVTPAGGTPNNDTAYSDEGRYRNVPVYPPGGDCPHCKFEQCVDYFAKGLKNGGYRMEKYDAFLGPNSNSFARRLIEICGGYVSGNDGPLTGWRSGDEVGF